MEWNVLNDNIVKVKENLIKNDISSAYNIILNHFFNSNRNVYITNDNEQIIGIINYKNFITNKYTLKDMILKDYIYVHSNADDKNIEKSFSKFDLEYLPVLDFNKHILYELKLIQNDNKLWINKKRWDSLYKNNKKISKALEQLEFKKIYIMGTLKSKVYNYIVINTKYNCFKIDSNKEEFISKINEKDSIIIDTDNINNDYRRWLVDLQKYNMNNEIGKYITIKELCDYSELIYFKEFYNNSCYNTILFEFQVPEDLTNLSFSEKLRIAFDKHYRYYYSNLSDPEVRKIVKNVLGDMFNTEFINSRNEMTGTILKNGVCYLADSNNQYCKVINGLRFTANKSKIYTNKINIFGACIVYGAVVDDEHTIPSLLQEKLNNNNLEYEVNNFGARAIDFYENIRTADTLNIHKNDMFIFVVSPEEKKQLEKVGITDIKKFASAINKKTSLHDYFMGEPVHCNAKANEIITEYIFNNIKNLLKSKNQQKNPELVKSSQLNNNSDYDKNPELIKYLKYLKSKKRNTPNNGAVMMNCNPFTNGHLKLIEYASKQVDTLYVFIVQEDKSYFKFIDRFEMAKESCKDLKNVVVLESGTVFGTFMTFQAYFDKETNDKVEVDASLDIELFACYVAPLLNISKRFVGDEPIDKVTQQYNRDLMEILPSYNIDVFIVPRFKIDENIISAKTVRKTIEKKDLKLLKKLVPLPTYSIIKNKYLNSNNFSDLTIKTDIKDYLADLSSDSLLIYSPTSLKKVNIDIKKEVTCLSTYDITKDKYKIDKIIDNIPLSISNIVTLGGGTAIDIGKYIAMQSNKNLIAIPSMLSTNVYATDKVALTINDKKTTLLAKTPNKILVDYDFLKKSSKFNLYGLADIFSIYTALYDWKLAESYNHENIDSKIYEQAQNLLNDTIYFIKNNSLENIINNIEKIYYIVGKAGMITNVYGCGRPESGSEHILAKEIEHNINIHHGISVSISIIIMSLIQGHSSKEINNCLLKIGIFNNINKLGVTRGLLFNILKNILPREDRYSIVDIYNRDDKYINNILDNYEKIIGGEK